LSTPAGQLEYVFYALRDHHVRALNQHPEPSREDGGMEPAISP
jgi:hypothetical protein